MTCYFTRMSRRPVLALLLLPWLLFGHGVPRPIAGGADRVFSATSLLDASTGPSFRVDGSRELARFIESAQPGHTAPRHSPPMYVAGDAFTAVAGTSCSAAALPSERERGFRPAWLAAPHDANAPPLS